MVRIGRLTRRDSLLYGTQIQRIISAVRPDLKDDIRENVLITMRDVTAIVVGAFTEKILIGTAVGRLIQSFSSRYILVTDLTVCNISWSEEVRSSVEAWFKTAYPEVEIKFDADLVKAPHLAEIVPLLPDLDTAG